VLIYFSVVRINEKKNVFEITVEKFSKQKSYLKFERRPHKFSNFVENIL